MLNKTALDLERKEAKKKRKSNKDPGFTSWADNTARQYNKLTKAVQPDWERYAQEKAEMGEDFYADSGTAAILPGRIKVQYSQNSKQGTPKAFKKSVT